MTFPQDLEPKRPRLPGRRPMGRPAAAATISLALACLTLLPSLSNATTYVDDFEGGVNPSGWAFIRGGDTFESGGGNPGGWLHQPIYDTFAPTLDHVFGASTPFPGDYRAANVTRISLDAQTLDLDFGNGDGFRLTLVLRDAKGTPSDVTDDDYVYLIGPNVPRVGEGWTHYDYEIPSQFSGNLPPGWKGGWAGDCETLRPGIAWDDVITNVERVEFWWIDPCLFAIFQQWNVGADNIAIEYGDPAGVEDGSEPGSGSEVGRSGGDALLSWSVSPNPASTSTTVRLTLTGTEEVSIDILTANGRRVTSLVSAESLRGSPEFVWNGRDTLGRTVPAGVYYVRVLVGGESTSRAITLVR